MEFTQYVAAVRKWFWLIILVAVVLGGAGYYVSRKMPTVYQASSTLLVQQSPLTSSAQYNDIIASERLAQTYSELLTRRPVLEKVISNLGLQATLNDLRGQISVKLVRDTQLIQVTVKNHDPMLAKRIADEVAATFIAQNREAQLSTFANSKEELSKQLDQSKVDISKTQAEIDQAKESQSPDPANLTRLQSDLSQYQLTYSGLFKGYQDIQMAEIQVSGAVRVAESADEPIAPTEPKVMLITIMAAALGLLQGVGLALLIEYLDDTIKTGKDVSQVLALPFLGGLLRIKQGEGFQDPLVGEGHEASLASEGYRILRTNIQFSSLDKPVKTIQVTSSQPGEGKTTVVANLGIAMALSGKKVIIVDSDLRRPKLHKHFGISNDHGLTTLLLVDHPDLRKAVVQTQVQNLMLVPSGPIPPIPSEILGSARMEGLIKYFKGQADVVIFDSPPVLGMADASVLANRVDGTVFVTNYGKTRRQLAVKAVEMLQQVGGKILGVAINRLTVQGDGYCYGYADSYLNEKRNHSASIRKDKREAALKEGSVLVQAHHRL